MVKDAFRPANRFDARWPGECDSCLIDFDEGEEVGYLPNDDLVCYDCCEAHDNG